MKIKINQNFLYFVYLIIFVIYIFTAIISTGFDDEFFNILIFEQYGLMGFKYTQIYDTHPPGSYISNAILFKLLGSWQNVRIFSAVLFSATAIFLSRFITKKYGQESGLIFLLLLAFNPAFLIWCTSIRWYAYLMCVMLWVLILPPTIGRYYWFKFSLGIFIMAFYSYMTFILFAPIFYLYYVNDKRPIKIKFKQILFFGSIFFLLYVPQLQIFFEHSISNTSYPNEFIQSAAYFYTSQISNQGIFPLSFFSSISLVGFLMILTSFFESKKRNFIKDRYFMSYLLINLILLLSTFASRLRSHLFGIPFQALWISNSFHGIRLRKTFLLGILLLLIANLSGIYNIINKNYVTKNSLNINISLAENFINAEYGFCDGKFIVITYDPKLSWHLDKKIHNLYSPYLNYKSDTIKNNIPCLILLNTFGGVSQEKKYELKNILKTAYLITEKKIQEDKLHKYKKIFVEEYPESVISASLYKNINIEDLNHWIKNICSEIRDQENLYCNL